MLICNEISFQARCLGGCRSVSVAGSVRDAQLASVDSQGYAWVDGELDPAISGIAVPLRDQAGRVVAAISVNMISGTMSQAGAKKKHLTLLRKTAQDIRTQMTSMR